MYTVRDMFTLNYSISAEGERFQRPSGSLVWLFACERKWLKVQFVSCPGVRAIQALPEPPIPPDETH